MIGAIVAVSANGVIGKNGDLPWHYSEDLKRFKQLTLDSTIIMGRNTWDSLPRKPLPKRRNIVITRRGVEGVEHYTSIEEALENADSPVWIIGGAQIYTLALPMIDTLDITYVPDIVEGENLVYFPKLDDSWKVIESSQNPTNPLIRHESLKRQPENN
jgi:dihydrofolate reductase